LIFEEIKHIILGCTKLRFGVIKILVTAVSDKTEITTAKESRRRDVYK
jgi:hypothetical protein